MKNVVAIVAAVLLGAVAVLAVSSYVKGIEEAAAGQFKTAVAIGKDVHKGDSIRADDLMPVQVGKEQNVIDWDNGDGARAVVGQIVGVEIKSGTALTTEMFSSVERRFAKELIRPGQRAITLPIGSDSGFAGMLVPGDVIDILITYMPASAMANALGGGTATEGPGAADTDADSSTMGTVTTFMMQNITILALDNRTTAGVFNAEGSDYNSKDYGFITIALKPEDAQLIIFAQQSAGVKMTFLLRNPEDRAPVDNVNAMDYKWFSRMLEQSGDH